MAWLAETDIEGELSYSITDTTQPTTTEVAAFIADIEAEVSGYFYAARVSVPSLDATTTPVSYKIAKQTALWGVCSRVIAAAGGMIRNTADKEEAYWERYVTKLAQIKDNPAILGSDAPFLTTFPALNIDGLTEDSDEYHEPVFAMDDEF